MKVLLISANTEQVNIPVLPLGTAFVATAVRKAGHDVEFINLMGDRDFSEVLRESFSRVEPEVIGISVRNIDDQTMKNNRFLLDPVREVINFCRELSDAPIVIGGAGFSIFPEAILEYVGADMGIAGEGERVFVELINQIEANTEKPQVPGLYLPNAGLTSDISHAQSLDEFDLPLHDGFPWIPPSMLEDKSISIPVQTRRGCMLDCNYCSTAIIEGRHTRSHSPQKVVRMLRRYAAAGFRHFQFVDNTFNFPPTYAEALCDEIIAADLDIRWLGIVYPSNVTDVLAEKMFKSGCRGISLGFESGSDKILKIMNKQFSTDEVRDISIIFKKQKISQRGFLLLGGSGETKETVETSLAFADSLTLDSIMIKIGIRIYPFTALAQTAIEEGMISADDNLLAPKFYIAPGMEEWTRETVVDWVADRPNWFLD